MISDTNVVLGAAFLQRLMIFWWLQAFHVQNYLDLCLIQESPVGLVSSASSVM